MATCHLQRTELWQAFLQLLLQGLVELPQELEAWGGVQGQVPQLALVHEALPLPSEQASAAAQHLLALASAAPW